MHKMPQNRLCCRRCLPKGFCWFRSLGMGNQESGKKYGDFYRKHVVPKFYYILLNSIQLFNYIGLLRNALDAQAKCSCTFLPSASRIAYPTAKLNDILKRIEEMGQCQGMPGNYCMPDACLATSSKKIWDHLGSHLGK